jgi:hypothetical protein
MKVLLSDLLTDDAPGFDKHAIAAEFPGYTSRARETYAPAMYMPATMSIGSDSYPGYVQSTSTTRDGAPKTVYVAALEWDNDAQRWTPNRDCVRKYTLRKDGRYREAGANYSGAPSLTIGIAQHYSDPHF